MSKKDAKMDAGMNGLDAFFTPPEQQTKAEPPTQIADSQPAPQHVTEPSPVKKTHKKSLLVRKPGIYLSEKVDERLDKEWRKQPRQTRKSKSFIVEEILRQHWGLPPLE